MNYKPIIYHLNNEHKITFLNDEWQLFAKENKAYNLTSDAVLNKPISKFISDTKCLSLYKMLMASSIQEQKAIRFPFRCDSPQRRRFMEMEIFPLKDNSVGFKSRVLREEVREPVLLLDLDIDRTDDFITVCSWCKKIKIDENNWVEVEEAIDKLSLLNSTSFPQLSHGICPLCYENAKKSLSAR